MKSILIADSGSTKTSWAFIEANGETSGFSHGINPNYQDEQSIFESLQSSEFLAKVELAKPYVIYFYGAGCGSLENQNVVRDGLQHFFLDSKIFVFSDLLGAARALCRTSPGIACILGTGSNSCLYNGSEIVSNLPNLGFWLGDEGSGGYLGKQLLIHWFHKEMPEPLWEKFNDLFEIDRDKVIKQIYHKPFPNRYLAGFAPFLNENQSDLWCQNLVELAFRIFLTRYVKPYAGSDVFEINFLGGIAFNFKKTLNHVLDSFGMKPGQIQNSAIEGLAEFHLKGRY